MATVKWKVIVQSVSFGVTALSKTIPISFAATCPLQLKQREVQNWTVFIVTSKTSGGFYQLLYTRHKLHGRNHQQRCHTLFQLNLDHMPANRVKLIIRLQKIRLHIHICKRDIKNKCNFSNIA